MFDRFPAEILIHLYSYLSHSDKNALRATCINCYKASLAFSVMQLDTLRLDRRLLKYSSRNAIQILKHVDRYFNYIEITSLSSDYYIWALQKFSPTMKSLTLTRCDVHFRILTSILSNAPFLDDLKLISCNLILSEYSGQSRKNVKLENLKRLEISNSAYLTDFILNKFTELCPQLQHLSVSTTTLNFHHGVHIFNYRSNTNMLQNPSNNVFTIQYLNALLTSRNDSIHELDLSHTLINATALYEILTIENLQLNHLNLDHCRELRRAMPIHIGELQPHITELHLSFCDFVTNDCLASICETLLQLKVLDISGIYTFDDDGFLCIKQLHYLEHFNFSQCCNVSGDAIKQLLTDGTVTSRIKILRMSNTEVNSYEFIYILCKLDVIELDISYCKNLNNTIINTLVISQRNLKRLNMANILFTDEGLTNFPKYLLKLPNINLDKYEFEDLMVPCNQKELLEESKIYFQLTTMQYTFYKLEKLTTLTSLDLSKCYLLTDFFLTVPMRLPNLTKISLADINNITTKAIMLLVNGCPSLEDIDLTNTSVDDIGVCVIVLKLYRLKIISLKGCGNITDVSLRLIMKRCMHLQKLYIHGCVNFNENLINDLKLLPTVIDVIGKTITKEASHDYSSVPNPPPLPYPLYF